MDKDKTTDINQNHIILGFFEFDFAPDIFTSDLGLQPLNKGLKGETYLTASKKIYEYNTWTYEFKSHSNDSIVDLTSKFINDIIKPRVDTIKRLTQNCKVQLRIVQYYYGGHNPAIYINSADNKILADINSSLDIDLYCLAK